MCGINGIYAYHYAANAPREPELLATRDAMAARGPDGQGAWWSSDRRCAFGHRRLAIIDLSDRAAQPMTSDDGRLSIVFNGEIYNYPDLKRELEAEGVRFRTSSDTEVLLHLYVQNGPAMVQKLRGMFAFALWDKVRGGLLLARDLYGIKPLYTANDGWTFRFASQVKALLAGGEVSREAEPAGIVGFHLFGSVPEPFTLYRDIRALPAGHLQWIDGMGPREPERFASIAQILAEGAVDAPALLDVEAQVREHVLDSVRAHLVADVEVGVFLSAGIDSGAVLGLMRDADNTRRPRAITLAFAEYKGTSEDEAPIAARVAAAYDSEHIVRTVSEAEFRADLPCLLAAMDQPSIDGINTWFVAKAARETGLKVALSGLGGDELLAGYPSFADIPRWRRRYGMLARLPGFGSAARLLIRAFMPAIMASTPKAAHVFDHAASFEGSYLLRRGLFLPGELSGMLEPQVLKEGLRRLKPEERLRSTLQPDPGTDVARVCALESSHYMRNQLLRDADWAGMAHGLEIRTPLVDRVLLENLAASIHGLRPGEGKKALATAPAKPLPAEVIERSKSGFTVPTGAWLSADTEGSGRSSKGAASRRWSQFVLDRSAAQGEAVAA
jgi:asparagine synthase (glutamine-hydrolysing)